MDIKKTQQNHIYIYTFYVLYKVSDKCEHLFLLMYNGQKESSDLYICANNVYLKLKPLWCH